ncbi:MAG TPA: hypothetical protein VIW45_16075 [Vicinamibacterales bacterium]|jgi:hypothetical protein
MKRDPVFERVLARGARPCVITAAVAAVLVSAPAGAQAQTVQNTTAHTVEWDLPAVADASPGAMLVDTRGDDNNHVWFVTRLGVPRVFRFTPPGSLMKAPAQFTSWELQEDSGETGGMKKIKGSRDRRYVFVRTAMSIQRIDTQSCDASTCARTTWTDQDPFNVSDLTVDDWNNVFTSAAVIDQTTQSPDLAQSYVQMLVPGSTPPAGTSVMATVTRWIVGGGAGFCADLGRSTTSFPCVSGIAAMPSVRNLIYYSEPEGQDGFGNIAELNTTTNKVRRWSLGALPADPEGGTVQQPRQLYIDRSSRVWVVTGSGHIVSLDPKKNLMRFHTMVGASASDPFGVAPDDDVVGYTDSSLNRVGMVKPAGPYFTVLPSPCPDPSQGTTCAVPVVYNVPIDETGDRSNFVNGSQSPVGSVVNATITSKQDGVFVDAFLDQNVDPMGHESQSPLGISPNRGKGEGTFWYAVGVASDNPSADRIGFIRLPHAQRFDHPRDDDDAEDGWAHNQHPAGWHVSTTGDDDDDGFDNTYDTPAYENIQVADPAPLPPGGTTTYQMTATSSTLALIAIETADDPTGLLQIDVLNSLGVVVATALPTPGVAVATLAAPAPGIYTVRVTNPGVTTLNQTATAITRSPWVQ